MKDRTLGDIIRPVKHMTTEDYDLEKLLLFRDSVMIHHCNELIGTLLTEHNGVPMIKILKEISPATVELLKTLLTELK